MGTTVLATGETAEDGKIGIVGSRLPIQYPCEIARLSFMCEIHAPRFLEIFAAPLPPAPLVRRRTVRVGVDCNGHDATKFEWDRAAVAQSRLLKLYNYFTEVCFCDCWDPIRMFPRTCRECRGNSSSWYQILELSCRNGSLR